MIHERNASWVLTVARRPGLKVRFIRFHKSLQSNVANLWKYLSECSKLARLYCDSAFHTRPLTFDGSILRISSASCRKSRFLSLFQIKSCNFIGKILSADVLHILRKSCMIPPPGHLRLGGELTQPWYVHLVW